MGNSCCKEKEPKKKDISRNNQIKNSDIQKQTYDSELKVVNKENDKKPMDQEKGKNHMYDEFNQQVYPVDKEKQQLLQNNNQNNNQTNINQNLELYQKQKEQQEQENDKQEEEVVKKIEKIWKWDAQIQYRKLQNNSTYSKEQPDTQQIQGQIKIDNDCNQQQNQEQMLIDQQNIDVQISNQDIFHKNYQKGSIFYNLTKPQLLESYYKQIEGHFKHLSEENQGIQFETN
ncbi:hypothetical protein PPERSA_04095 [Pseudocohnilembus persalinus]|uniref:Uncharacterized protein n=1 Tax=Pseudocohnilembus persalinus TaxID=266149 RepID=A0A0V0QL90_PSEPJ|nr:hypothetical protein PPERSA_04095 [Pseudocohnilembus persalinus]|eukprot:KRX02892.1 hypothetical protein PPERSA_04095 [Pseudocohnilembus persalinus]